MWRSGGGRRNDNKAKQLRDTILLASNCLASWFSATKTRRHTVFNPAEAHVSCCSHAKFLRMSNERCFGLLFVVVRSGKVPPPPRFYSFCVVSLIKVAVWKGATINGNGWILAAYVAEFLSEQSPIFEGMAIKFADNKRQYVKGI